MDVCAESMPTTIPIPSVRCILRPRHAVLRSRAMSNTVPERGTATADAVDAGREGPCTGTAKCSTRRKAKPSAWRGLAVATGMPVEGASRAVPQGDSQVRKTVVSLN